MNCSTRTKVATNPINRISAVAQKFSSMVLSLRKKSNLRVRQPLNKLMIPVLDKKFERQLKDVEDLILSEVNVKEIEYLQDTAGVLVKSIKPNFKALGPKYGKMMKQIAAAVNAFGQDEITAIEQEGRYVLDIDGQELENVVDLDSFYHNELFYQLMIF